MAGDSSPNVSPAGADVFEEGGHGPPFAGLVTFNRIEHTRELDEVDLAVVGVPFDSGAANRSGARFGPRAIREQSLYADALPPVYPWKEDPTAGLRVIDYGDIVAIPGTGAVESLLEQSESVAAEVFGHGAGLLTLGGDHTLPYGPVRAAAKAFGPVAMIHLDSHQDSLDSAAFRGPRLINHGTFATDLVREGAIDSTRSTQLYIRTYLDNPGGYTIHYADDARELGPERLAESVRELVGDAPAYVSLDIDAVDPAFAPGVGTPVPGGPSSGEVRRFLRGLAGLDVVAADIVELNPAYDPAQSTAILAAFLSFDLLYLIAGAVRRRRSRD